MRSLLGALAAGILFFLLVGGGCSLDTRTTDLLHGDLLPLENVVIVAIDERSLDEVGEYPWPRATHAQLIDVLAEQKPRVIAFDIGFFDDTDVDELNAAIQSAREQGIAVVASEQIHPDGTVSTPAVEVASGYSNLIQDVDGFVRSVPLNYLGRDPFALVVAESHQRVFLPAQNQLPIRFIDVPGTIPTYSYVDALAGTVSVSDDVVFVGVTAAALHDDYLTPVSSGQKMSGVEIHATIYQMFVTGSYLQHVEGQSYWLILFALLGGLVVWLTFVKYYHPYNVFYGLLFIPAYVLVVVTAFNSGVLLNPVTPILAYFSGAGGAGIVWVIMQQKEKQYLRKAFEKYVSPDLIKKVLKNPKRLALGGERRELTILFSDIRGFTSISENLTPEELVSLLNDYLTAMTDLVQDHQGTVDKYIGDAIMTFWNAPLDQKDHASRACHTALCMMKTLRELQKEERFKDLRIGIGVNTGEVVVGNMGSHQRFDYTCMGDDVNLASRLESLTKQYKVDILVSGATMRAAGAGYGYRKLDRVRVKGKSKPIRIYELLEKSKNHDAWEAAIMDYFEGRWKDARKKFTKINDTQAKIILNRMNELKNKPPKDWDGVWTHTSK